jgi:riboflavin synthase
VFTGLVEDMGRVAAVAPRGDDARDLELHPGRIDVAELALGESIAVDGVCLTVTARGAGRFAVTAGPETLARTTLGGLRVGERVNLERALRAGDRLGGHIVAGHVDAVGTVAERRPLDTGFVFRFRAAPEVLRYVVEKGSIAVDGISLTVNAVDAESFDVALIPHTVEMTTLADKQAGSRVNLEVDIIGKYVEKLLGGRTPVERG